VFDLAESHEVSQKGVLYSAGGEGLRVREQPL